ncbi:DedA family protein [candidate division KSB1 bacterium]
MVTIRSFVAITAGILNLDKNKVFYLALISVLMWNSILIYIGYIVGENWQIVLNYLRNYNILVLSALFLIVTVYFLARLIKNKA